MSAGLNSGSIVFLFGANDPGGALIHHEPISNHLPSSPFQGQLTAIQGPLKGSVFPIHGEKAVIGSGSQADVMLTGDDVLPRHAGLRWNGSAWEIFDLTGDMIHINDIPSNSRSLGGGEILRIGDHELHFTLQAEVENSASVSQTEAVLSIGLEREQALSTCQQLPILAGPGYTIGRTPDNDLSIHDPLASRRHCRIEVIRGEAVLTDLGSLNGTHLEGRPIHQATLRAGELIVVGKTALRCLRPIKN